ncbi:MAG TPA: ComEC/Rec2 family competence protein [Chitinophagaceae bacterium]
MRPYPLHVWQEAPFLRLVIPFIGGITVEWYSQLLPAVWWILLLVCVVGLWGFNRRFSFRQFRLGWLNGILIQVLFFSLGALVCWSRDAAHQPNRFTKYYHPAAYITVTLEEPLSEKENSFKAIASVEEVSDSTAAYSTTGTVLLYFKKEASVKYLGYGDRLLFNKPLQLISNTGNPGAFDYRQYEALQGVYRQVYLRQGEFVVLAGKNRNWFTQWIYATRQKVTGILSRYIPGEKEAGLAEALLIGYKDDLDKGLLQSYSNTGVVHIIAISGLHVGLIYWLLMLLTKPLQIKRLRWLRPWLTITGLWLFALLAGGGPSVLRSALMFSCIIIGQQLSSGTSIYNTLSISAFILLCIDPSWCWDVGFQLSYIAVLSIVIFMKPIYHLLSFQNKGLDFIWKLNAVTLAAQVLTVPLSIYHFHQFPNYFLVTNLVAVPLSTAIVLGEIVLCALAVVPFLAAPVGLVLQWGIRLMNDFISHMENMPGALWNGLELNVLQLLLMYSFIAGIAYWLLEKNRTALLAGLCGLAGFAAARTYSFEQAGRQQLLVVYNLPRHQAIDFISGRAYLFKGDSELAGDAALQRFYITPCRMVHRVCPAEDASMLKIYGNWFVFNNKRILLVDEGFRVPGGVERISADLVIVSGRPSLSPAALVKRVDCRQLVFDGSVSARMVNKWKEEGQKLGLACFYVVDNGAFVMNLR